VITDTGTLDQVIDVAAGSEHSVAVREDGTVWAWGNNARGCLGRPGGPGSLSDTAQQVAGVADIVAVAAGYCHTYALDRNGDMWAWGDNYWGQLGNGGPDDSITPVRIAALSGVAAVAAGLHHGLALLGDGTVQAWGDNQHGQLGRDNFEDAGLPGTVTELQGVTALAGGREHSLALLDDGTMAAWGNGSWGEIGNGETRYPARAAQAQGVSGATVISTGPFARHTLAGSPAGVLSWGDNEEGQLGNGSQASSNRPVQVTDLVDVVSLATGSDHSVAALGDGTAWAWGYNQRDQLGNGGLGIRQTAPVQVLGISDVRMVSAGELFSLALLGNGTVWGWGANGQGQIGDGDAAPSRDEPRQSLGLTGAVSIAAGSEHSLAVTDLGEVWTWGDNAHGQLGTGNTDDSDVPVPIAVPTDVIAVAAGGAHSLALQADGTIWVWGGGSSLPDVSLGVPDGAIAVGAGEFHSLAVARDGSVWAWGLGASGQLGNGVRVDSDRPVRVLGLTNAVAVGGGEDHSIALLSDGTVWGWGGNWIGQLGDGAGALTPVPAAVDTGWTAEGVGASLRVARDGEDLLFNWLPVLGAEFYRLRRDGEARFLSSIIAAVATEATVTETPPSGSFFYLISGVNCSGDEGP